MNDFKNELHLADCIDLLKDWHLNGRTNFIDLIYIDPPFNKNRDFNIIFDSKLSEEAFIDTWSSISYLDELDQVSTINPLLFNFLNLLDKTNLPKTYISYLTKMSIRCWYMREMLKDTGSFVYHCDQTMSHYIKIILDFIFGLSNYRNEILWCYYGAGSPGVKQFLKRHDTLYWYSKTNNWVWNVDDVRIPYANYTRSIEGQKGAFGTSDKKDGSFILHPKGKIPEDFWTDIGQVFRKRNENLKYPTQKPEALLERIILSTTNEKGIVADFFMGGGTTVATANKLNRKFIGGDINYRALQITQKRIEKQKNIIKKDFIVYGIPRSSVELKDMVDNNILGPDKNSKFAFETVITKYYLPNVVGNPKQVGDHSIDGRFIFDYRGKKHQGIVQITTGSNISHLKSFCAEIGKGTGEIGIYVAFEEKVTKGMYIEAKSYGKFDGVDRVQILTVEDLIDRGKTFSVPKDILTI